MDSYAEGLAFEATFTARFSQRAFHFNTTCATNATFVSHTFVPTGIHITATYFNYHFTERDHTQDARPSRITYDKSVKPLCIP